MLGKKLYRTGMINLFRLIILGIVIFFVNDFILDTYTYDKFQADGRFKIIDVIQYHLKYPHEFITFFFVLLGPAFYYSLIRGVRFYEKGFIFNRGLPFFNKVVPYEDVKTYKLLHPKLLLTIHTASDVFLVADNSVERVVAILDQHHIQGDLGRDDYTKLISNFWKFTKLVLAFTFVMFLFKKLGLFFR